MADVWVSKNGSNTVPYDNWGVAANDPETALDFAKANLDAEAGRCLIDDGDYSSGGNTYTGLPFTNDMIIQPILHSHSPILGGFLCSGAPGAGLLTIREVDFAAPVFGGKYVDIQDVTGVVTITDIRIQHPTNTNAGLAIDNNPPHILLDNILIDLPKATAGMAMEGNGGAESFFVFSTIRVDPTTGIAFTHEGPNTDMVMRVNSNIFIGLTGIRSVNGAAIRSRFNKMSVTNLYQDPSSAIFDKNGDENFATIAAMVLRDEILYRPRKDSPLAGAADVTTTPFRSMAAPGGR